ncbi:oysgedart [Anaeramoeba flamelloides]|uniref:Oysgedart n=1 Tax=Anaeramoeba flamelloides TaxID=1746091 RepID=A0ABQ8YYX2_9EUKA|nr:oysgedart [Anaeramoeba flamelloides]
MKLTKFSWDYYDGKHYNAKAKIQNQNRITELPSFFEFFSYVLHWNTVLMGPPIGIKRYLNHINGNLIEDSKNQFFKKTQVKPKQNDNRYKYVFKSLFVSVISLIIVVIGQMHFKEDFVVSDYVYSKPFYLRIFLVKFGGFLIRCKYYFGMTITIGANIVTGLNFNGFIEDGSYKWDALTMINPKNIELSQSAYEISKNWNIETGLWLQQYVYLKLTNSENKKFRNRSISTMITFAISAIFHGFYPGYYMTFAIAALTIITGRVLRRHFRSLFIDPKTKNSIQPGKKIYDIICFICMIPTMDSIGIPLALMSFERIKRFFVIIAFFPILGSILIILIFSNSFFLKFTKKLKNKNNPIKVEKKLK